MFSKHNIQAGNPSKRYKLYETLPVPKRTMYRKNAFMQLTEDNTGSTSTNQQTLEDQLMLMSTVDQASDPNEMDMSDDLGEQPMDLVDTSSSEDEDFEDENGTIKEAQEPSEASSDPLIYVIPSRDSLYSCPVSRSEYQLALGAFISKYNMSSTMAEDLMKFSQLLIPETNLCETSLAQLQRSCGFNSEYLQYHLYCSLCKKLFDIAPEDESCKTPGCNGPQRNSSYFVTGNLNMQFTVILERDGIWECIEEMRDTVSFHC